MSVIIPVNEQYRIELNQYSWQISKWRTKESSPKGGGFEGIHWYPKLSQACDKLVLLLITQSNLTSAQEIVTALADASQLLAEAITRSETPDSWANAQRSCK